MTSVSMPIQPIVLAQLEQVVAAALCAPEPLATAAFEAVQGVTPTEGSGLLAPAMPPGRVTLDE